VNPAIVLSMPQNGGKNYINAFSSFGFDICGDYLTANTCGDGLVLCGGGDIDPSFYGEAPCGSMPPDLLRDKSEFFLFEKYYSAGKPIFGICRGVQLINVALGGTLIQHLKSTDAHKGENDIIHTVENTANTPAYTLFGKKMTVNSSHHQACGKTGQGLSVMQVHYDGTAEGIYGKRIIGVQWHPERMCGSFENGIYTPPAPLFEFFRQMITGE